jgi:phosphatidylethanolamine/phosphatidyl-N-methylethanolamine N-methyltransferase
MRNKILFLKKYLKAPQSIGSVMPSSEFLAKAIFKSIKELDEAVIIEIGAGTGAITKHISSLNPLLVEIDAEFCELLRQKYPHLKTINSCAIEQLKKVDQQFGLVLSIPLINNPFKSSFIPIIESLYSRGLLLWCVLYTYGLNDPLGEVNFHSKARKRFVIKNIPPASVWVYS